MATKEERMSNSVTQRRNDLSNFTNTRDEKKIIKWKTLIYFEISVSIWEERLLFEIIHSGCADETWKIGNILKAE